MLSLVTHEIGECRLPGSPLDRNPPTERAVLAMVGTRAHILSDLYRKVKDELEEGV